MPDQPQSVEAQLAVIRTEIGFIKDHITNGHADHEVRIRAQEQFKWLVLGGAAAAGGAAGYLANIFVA